MCRGSVTIKTRQGDGLLYLILEDITPVDTVGESIRRHRKPQGLFRRHRECSTQTSVREIALSLQIEIAYSVPKETARVAKAAFPKGAPFLKMRDELGTLFEDEDFSDLFPPQGHAAEAPWRLALVTVMQFAEGLSDRQAADAVRSRIDWKYALGIELTDEGFDFSVLSEFRTRLLQNTAENRLFDRLLALARERGWLKAGGKQRTDSTHVLAAVRALNRLELVGETLRHALNTLAEAAPDWLGSLLPPEWIDRYGRRFASVRLPQGKEARENRALLMGSDGFALLKWLQLPQTPVELSTLPEIVVLRRVWIQNFVYIDHQLTWRSTENMPPNALSINSPHDPEARYSVKRDTNWSGYKAHLSETCDEDTPRLITHVETTPATTQDSDTTEQIHKDLQEADLLPARHFADSGYLDAQLLVESPQNYAVDLYGPVPVAGSWQATAQEGFGSYDFHVDWEQRQVTCPHGKQSVRWRECPDSAGNPMINVRFSHADCAACPFRSQCTKSVSGPRGLSLRPKEQYDALHQARERQKTEEFRKEYGLRSGIEGTLSQAVRRCGLRQTRYIGQAKTHLSNLMIATALNLVRMISWLMDVPLAKTRVSPLTVFRPENLPPATAMA